MRWVFFVRFGEFNNILDKYAFPTVDIKPIKWYNNIKVYYLTAGGASIACIGEIMDWWVILLIALGVISALLALGAWYTITHAFLSARKKGVDYYRSLDSGRCHDPERCRALIGKMLALDLERVTIRSHDGLTLVGHYYEVKRGAPIEIFFHGFRGSWQRDFCGITEAAVELSHNVLFVDQRSHGESEGRFITYGIKERYDALAWIDYVLKRFGDECEIVLVGASMGGATVLSVSELYLPGNVKAIISDSAFTSPIDIITKVAGGGAFKNALVRFGASCVARVFCGFNIFESSAVCAVKNAKTPIMLLHGVGDRLVPHEMAVKMADSNPSIRLESFEGADHIQPYLVDTERYKAAYKEFLEKCGVSV